MRLLTVDVTTRVAWRSPTKCCPLNQPSSVSERLRALSARWHSEKPGGGVVWVVALALRAAGLDLFDDGGDHLVEITDHRPVGLGDHVCFGIDVDGEDVLARHRPDPVLDGA